ncbi:MAG: hypothetical protein WC966_06870 [Bradymonadales bacterium]|jgi:hypothetical protein
MKILFAFDKFLRMLGMHRMPRYSELERVLTPSDAADDEDAQTCQ